MRLNQICMTSVLLFSACLAFSQEEMSETYKETIEKRNSGKKSSLSEEDMAILTKGAEDIAASLKEPGLKVGETAPDFELVNADGKMVKLSDALAKGPVVLSFFRGNWCPYCNIEMVFLAKKLDEFKKLGATLIVVSPQKVEKSKEFHDKFKGDFEVLSDLDYKAMESFKLVFDMPKDLLGLYKDKFKIDLEASNGEGRTKLPVPATFVIGKDGKIVFAFADLDYKKRAEPADLVEVLKTLK